jgi:hypothetical protein
MAWQFATITVAADSLNTKKAYEYEATVIGILRMLDTTETGHAVLNGIRFYQRGVLVYPYDGARGPCNARSYHGLAMRPYTHYNSAIFRTKVWFTPRLYSATSGCVAPGDAGHTAHEVLVHELTHAIRLMSGTVGPLSLEASSAAFSSKLRGYEQKPDTRPVRTGEWAKLHEAVFIHPHW